MDIVRLFSCAKSRRRGFSLVELMVVLAIAIILLGIGVPAFGGLIQNQRVTTTVNEFMAAISLTRSEAVKRGARVDLVPAGSDWTEGWVVFVDDNNNQKPDSGEQIIFTRGPVAKGMAVTSHLTDEKSKYLAYGGAGRTLTNASGMRPQFGTFRFRLGEYKRNVVINMLGRPYVCIPKNNDEAC